MLSQLGSNSIVQRGSILSTPDQSCIIKFDESLSKSWPLYVILCADRYVVFACHYSAKMFSVFPDMLKIVLIFTGCQ